MTAAYAKITNNEPTTVCLTEFSADFAQEIQLHITETAGDAESGRVRMQRLPQLCIESGQTAQLAPGGMHFMVMGVENLPSPATAEESAPPQVSLTLGTSEGRDFEARFEVRLFNE